MKEHEGVPQISRRNFLKGAAALGIAIGISGTMPLGVFGAEAGRIYAPGEIVRRGDSTIPNVFLTFDDDWKNVPLILDIAREKDAKITFCPVGQTVNKNKALWQEVLLEGHTIENHTWSHRNLNKLTKNEIETQIVRQRELVEGIAYQAGFNYKEVFLRPPGGRANLNVQDVARRLGLVIVNWSVSSAGTSKTKTEDKVYHNVVDNLKNGAIVLQHALLKDIHVLPGVIDEARRQGYSVNTSLREGIPTTVYSA